MIDRQYRYHWCPCCGFCGVFGLYAEKSWGWDYGWEEEDVDNRSMGIMPREIDGVRWDLGAYVRYLA
jgi:hypothetical protein